MNTPDHGPAERDLASYDLADLPRIVSFFYQPVVDLVDGRVTRLEALARALGSDGRLVSPQPLLAYVAATGAEATLTSLTFERAADAAARLARAGVSVPIGVNLTPAQLTVEVADQLDTARAVHRLPRSALAVEVVEAPALGAEAELTLERLAHRGYAVVRDDVGAGAADLMAIAAVPFAGLKVDRALIERLVAGEARATAVVRAIAGLGRELGARVVAEGVEDVAAARAHLLMASVREAQGFGVARPMPLDSLCEALVRTRDGQVRLATEVGHG